MVKPTTSRPRPREEAEDRVVVCGMCGQSFVEDRGQPTCQGCPLASGCHFVRCPHCGFENPVAPQWLERLKDWLRREDAS